jgi:prepilin-type N-terminal cleavage/methylation domain-containing protein
MSIRNHTARRQQGRSAFTLVECLVAASIAGVLGLSVFSVFSAGLRIYRQFGRDALVQENILLALERFERDLRSTFVFVPLSFSGDSLQLAFPLLTGKERRIGQISYVFDPATGTLARGEHFLSDNLVPDPVRYSRKDVLVCRALSFEYYSPDPATGRLVWQNTFSSAGALPRLVRVRFVFQQDGNIYEREKTVQIPSAG